MRANSDDARESLRLVRDSAASVVPREEGPQRIRSLRFREPGFDLRLWKEMCGLGWPGLRIPEGHGGSGLDVAAFCAVARELGAALAPEPFIAVASAARHLTGERLAGVLRGDLLIVPAWREHPHDFAPANRTRLRDGRVSGTKHLVSDAVAAHAFVVSTKDGLALVERDAPGVTVSSIGLHDGGFAADLRLDDAPAEPLTGSLEGTLEECALANAAYLQGAMESAFDMTIAYISVRKQFGRPIGSFQALQHRAVDMKIQIELARAVIDEAAASLDQGRGDLKDRQALVSRAKMRAADAAMQVAKECVQFHGAIGMTDECDIGLYARKILTVHNDWGSVTAHRQRFIAIEQARHD